MGSGCVPSPLDTFTDTELFEELTKRNRVVVLITDRENRTDSECGDPVLRYDGGFLSTLGALEHARHFMLRDQERGTP